jgi:hypothetical protein
MQAKRVQGAPRAGKPGDRVNVSVVVTDVKGFSALTRQYPDAMIKAMGGHNNIMRKVRWYFCALGSSSHRVALCRHASGRPAPTPIASYAVITPHNCAMCMHASLLAGCC